ncbi:MAG TPA: hypothetical protein VMS64_20305 [Candidatus Methylomirabilis sp.]|nr:hypothetical protein [Candidatus Methylomirabilis sp.]
MLQEVEVIENLPELVEVAGADVYFIGSGGPATSPNPGAIPAGRPRPEVQQLMEGGITIITAAGRTAGSAARQSSPRSLGVQYFHSSVNRLHQQCSVAHLQTMRQAAGAGK